MMGKEPVAVAVPLSLPPVKVTPVGRGPDSVMVGAGKPVAAGVNELSTPSVKVVLSAVVMVGGPVTVRVKSWVALLGIPLAAVKVMGKVPDTVGVPVSAPPGKGHPGGQGPGLGDGRGRGSGGRRGEAAGRALGEVGAVARGESGRNVQPSG